jgi:hypothetical protein
MKQLWFLLVFACCSLANAQDLLVKYDFIKDKFFFYENGKLITQPVIKKNYEVKVQVENLNPFVFVARCDWKQNVVTDNSSMSGIAGMFKGMSGIGSLSTLLTGLNMGQFEDLGIRGGASLLETNLTAKSTLQNAINCYNKLYDVEQTMNQVEYSSNKLQKLKFNPYLPADTLKKIALELTATSLKKKTNERNLTATGFIQFSTAISNTLNTEYDNLMNYSNSFLNEYNTYAARNGNNFAEAGMDKTIATLLNAAAALKQKYTAENISTKIDALEMQYETITYTPFSYTCNYLATGDNIGLTLDIFQSSMGASNTGAVVYTGSDGTDTLRKVRSKSINILVKGDVKITTSVGLGFPSYFDKNKTWSNKDSIITGTAGNNLAPCISTYINFYPYSGRNVHWGGTFGIGIPVQSEGTSTLNFFLGGSAVLGSNSKVVIHAGLAIGQLNVLGGGQKEGDKLKDGSELPTTKKTFQPGAFFGISFALNK